MKRLFITLVRIYQRYISPLTPPSCRYNPTCSQYTVEAIEKHGALKGSLMGLSRIMRCHPFTDGGFDSVPDHFTLSRNSTDYQEKILCNTHKTTAISEVEELLITYRDRIRYREEQVTLKQAIEELVTLQPKSSSHLSDQYIESILQHCPSRESISLEVYQVVRDEQSQHYKNDASSLEMQEALFEGDIGLLIGTDNVIYDCSSSELLVDIVLNYGITKEDRDCRTERFFNYIYMLHELHNERI